MARITSGYFSCILYAMLVIVFCSCDKSETVDRFSNYQIVEFFDDTLASPFADIKHIVAGNNRLFMCYGYTFTVYGNAQPGIPYIVTDNNGKIIRSDATPAGYYFNKLLSLYNGTFLIAATSDAGGTLEYVYFFHFDNNGSPISKDSVALGDEGLINSISLTNEGTILITYGYTWSSHYILECDIHGRLLWKQQKYQTLDNPMLLDDGGFLFTYINPDNSFFLHKLNSTGDSVWHKTFYVPFNPVSRFMCRKKNGNYLLAVYDANGPKPVFGSTGQGDFQSQTMMLYEVTPNGDSVRASYSREPVYYHKNSVLPQEDGSIFMLAGSRNAYTTYVLNILNSGYAHTESILLDNEFNVIDKRVIQRQSIDDFQSACTTSDGKIVCFGLVKSYEKLYFKPCLIILN